MFTPAFREALGVPLNYATILQSDDSSPSVALANGDPIEVDDSPEPICEAAVVAHAAVVDHFDAMDVDSSGLATDGLIAVSQLSDDILLCETTSRIEEVMVCQC